MDKIRLDKKTVLLLGTARSGTTWLSNLLSAPFRYRNLFEPFHPYHVDLDGLIRDRYYSGSIPAEVSHFCRNVLTDRISSNWIRQNVAKNQLVRNARWWPRARIVKDIHSNLFIEAYRTLFGMNLPIIVLVRNPFEVIESMVRANFPWSWDLKTLLSQNEFGEKYGIPLSKLESYGDSKVGAFAVRWSIENGYILKNAKGLKIYLQHYHDLFSSPIRELAKLANFAEIRLASGIKEKISLKSQTTHKNSPIYSKSRKIGFELTAQERSLIEEVLNVAGIEYDPQAGTK